MPNTTTPAFVASCAAASASPGSWISPSDSSRIARPASLVPLDSSLVPSRSASATLLPWAWKVCVSSSLTIISSARRSAVSGMRG